MKNKSETIFIIVVAIILVIAIHAFAQQPRGRRSTGPPFAQTDPNSWKNDLPVLPDIRKPKSKKTLEERVVELEERVTELEKIRDELIMDNMLLEMNLKNYISYMLNEPALNEKARREKRESMTEEERDRAAGIYPLLPKYGEDNE